MLGLTPIGKDDGLSGLQFPASMDAYVAIVKSGRGECAQGESSYNIVIDVSAGDLLSTPFDQAISHVTYCECSAAAETATPQPRTRQSRLSARDTPCDR